MKKLETFDSIHCLGKSRFEDDGTQNYSVFQMVYRFFKTVSANDSTILSWKSKGLSDESIKPPSTSNEMFNPLVDYVGTKIIVRFNGDWLKQEKITFNHGKIVNIYIISELEKSVNISSYSTAENCLLGTVKLTKRVDVNLYKYFRYGIVFDRKESYSFGDEVGRNLIIFGADMSLSPHIDNKLKDILILGKGPAQPLDHTLTRKVVSNQLYKRKYKIFFKLALQWSK